MIRDQLVESNEPTRETAKNNNKGLRKAALVVKYLLRKEKVTEA